MPVAIQLAPDGSALGAPRRAPASRVFVQGGIESGYAISPEGFKIIAADPEARRTFIACALSFREWLNVWEFTPEGGSAACLGENLWPAQAEYARIASEHPWTYFLKARQLGESTIACAFDGWAIRFGPANARAHIFSKMDAAACDLLDLVADGLAALPKFMRLPLTRETAHVRTYAAGPGDTRTLRAYAADRGTSRGSTATHIHLDEWAFMQSPADVWRSVEPTLSGKDTTCHIVTTGHSPNSPASVYYRKCMEGKGKHHPSFAGALDRPDRDEAWLEGQSLSMPEEAFTREYAQTWQDALSGSEGYYFRPMDVDQADVDARPPGPSRPDRRYVTAWDVGLVHDASVGTVIDITDQIYDVVAQERFVGITAPELQYQIQRLHRQYPGKTTIEDTGLGLSIRQGLDIPMSEVDGFSTTGQSKPRILSGLKVALQRQELKWSHDAFPDLTNEMRGYSLDDDFLTTDCVLSLAIALDQAASAHLHEPGRMLQIIRV